MNQSINRRINTFTIHTFFAHNFVFFVHTPLDAQQPMYPQAASHGNVLTFTPRGFSQTLNVKFPDSRLAVCEKCKKVSFVDCEPSQREIL